MKKKVKDPWIRGAIAASFIADSLDKHRQKTDIGAHELFIGQVRADSLRGQVVEGIEYSAYEEMALIKIHELREEAFQKFALTCLHIHHSLGLVRTGELSFFIFASSPHRKACREAVGFLVERFKRDVPVFGKEIFEGGETQWKINKSND